MNTLERTNTPVTTIITLPSLHTLLTATTKQQSKLLQTITDIEWQEYFQQLKDINIPSLDTVPTNHSSVPRIANRKWLLTNSEEIKTTYEYHCDAIKDTLKVIRKKSKAKIIKDAVYSVGNIKELLRYEPDMQSRLINDDGFTYFEVWLDK